MGDIFISHASADASSAASVAAAVRQANHRIFLDSDRQDGIAPGAAWQRTLFRELRLCDVVVYLNSRSSQASMWCHTELSVATELGKRVYSLDLAQSPGPHPLLQSLQSVGFESTLEVGIERLIESLGHDGLVESTSAKWDRTRPPYPGLAAMDVADAGVFFGRDTEVRNLVARVDGPLGYREGDLVVVMGPSGSGKSSLVRAGLVARLAMPRSDWAVVDTFEPGTRPLDRLVSRLVAIVPDQLSESECRDRLLSEGMGELGEWLIEHTEGPSKRLLITLDQAEQLATVTQAPEREIFLTALGRGLGAGSPVTIVMTVRSDRFDEIQRLPVFGAAIHDPFVVAPMSRSQLTTVIEGPAGRADVTFGTGLVGRLIDDALRGSGGEAVDALPLLAFTLREMYDLVVNEDRHVITEADYERVGCIEGAIIRRAKVAESLLPPDSGPILDSLLPRFVTLSEERLPAGRPVARDQLTSDERVIVEKLEDQRLLTGAGDTIHLAHEQLINAWPTLAHAVEDRRDDLLLETRIKRQAHDWKVGTGELLGRDATGLAVQWLGRQTESEADQSVVGEYVHASQRALRRRRNRVISVLSVVAALALIASAVAVVAFIQRSNAIDQSRLAHSVELASEGTSLFPSDAPFGMIVSLQAYDQAPTTQAGSALIQAAEQPLNATLSEGIGVNSVAFSPNGKILAVGDDDGDVKLWSTASGKRTATLTQESDGSGVDSVAFSPNGQILAVGDGDGKVGLWSIASGKRTGNLTEINSTASSGDIDVRSVSFSPNGQALAAGGGDGDVGLWDTASGKRTATLTEDSDDAQVYSIAFSPNGQTLAVGDGDGDVGLWSATNAQRTGTLPIGIGVSSVAFSPNGQTLAVATAGANVGLWNTATGNQTATLSEGSDDVEADSVAFSPNGQTLAVGDEGGDVGLWDTANGQRTATLSGGSSVECVAFSPSGQTLAVGDNSSVGILGGSDGDVRLWDTGSELRTATMSEGNPVNSVSFSPNGQTLAVGDHGQDVGLWGTANAQRKVILDEDSGESSSDGSYNSVTFSPNGQILAVGDYNGAVGLWDTASDLRTATLSEGNPVDAVAFSPNGQTLAVGDSNGDVGLWNAASGKRVGTLSEGSNNDVDSIAFSPNGQMLAVGDDDGTVGLWDTASNKRTSTLTEDTDNGIVNSVAFSPNGQTLAVGDGDGDVGLWSTASRNRIATLSEGNEVKSLDFSPSGQTLAVGDGDGDVGLWDTASLKRIASLAEGSPVESVAFSPDGHSLAVGDIDGGVELFRQNVWNLNFSSFSRLVCSEVRGNMTQAQWTAIDPDQAYQRTCPSYPAMP